jgi:hypothetical protein
MSEESAGTGERICACVARDATDCARIRDGYDTDDPRYERRECECSCHCEEEYKEEYVRCAFALVSKILPLVGLAIIEEQR